MDEEGILQPFGWFLDLEIPTIRFVVGNNHSNWMANLFSKSLDAVDWIKGSGK